MYEYFVVIIVGIDNNNSFYRSIMDNSIVDIRVSSISLYF